LLVTIGLLQFIGNVSRENKIAGSSIGPAVDATTPFQARRFLEWRFTDDTCDMDKPVAPDDLITAAAWSRRRIEDLQRENRTLEGTIVALQQRLLCENGVVAQDQNRMGELREANQQLVLATFGAEDAQLAAEAVNRRQSVFLSMLAHELRNPMASISVAGSVIASLKIDHARLSKLLAIMHRQISHLLRLVDDLLDASRINTGKISLQTRRILLGDVIDCAVETANGSLVARMQMVSVVLPALPVFIEGDLVRLAQLFSNLLINASKFSPPRSTIWVSASSAGGVLTVRVKDEGKGIAPEFHASIFELFAQGAAARDHSLAGGLGIGLALVRTVAQMHGGRVSVESDGEGRGSTFIVTLPLADQEAGDGQGVAAAP
jgi:signal transduction histidine kinase